MSWQDHAIERLRTTWHDDNGNVPWASISALSDDLGVMHEALGADLELTGNMILRLWKAPMALVKRDVMADQKSKAEDYQKALTQIKKQVGKLKASGALPATISAFEIALKIAKDAAAAADFDPTPGVRALNETGSEKSRLFRAAARALSEAVGPDCGEEQRRAAYNLAVTISGTRYEADWSSHWFKSIR